MPTAMFKQVKHAVGLVEALGLFSENSHDTVALQLQRRAASHPRDTFLLFESERYTYAQANALINRHAHAYRALGIGKSHVVALVMENRPEFLWHVFALYKLGAISSLINPNLQGDPLLHAIRICGPRHVVVGSEVWSNVAAIRERLVEQPPTAARAITLDVEVDVDLRLDSESFDAPLWAERLRDTSVLDPIEAAQQRLSDIASFIYTSGTTGLPKAAIVRHHRLYRAGRAWASLAFAYRSGDVLYNCLPLYHANSALLATCSVVTAGATMALSRKFSRSRFWDEVRNYNATGFIYIGELCRYLMNSESSLRDRDHHVRAISGNGLRPDIWRGFQQRFGIRRIVEFYGATEGNCITLNVLGVPGSVGPMFPGMRLARWDVERDDFVRDERGSLVRAKVDEPGLLLGRIRRHAQFDGYQDKIASASKVVRDAFEPGDAWFNTGDLLRMDVLRHLHFVDRLGDTYRWKGENVATSEVQEELLRSPAVQEANVYGVSVPGAEGRTGMAALVLSEGQAFDAASMQRHLEVQLPAYARPRFIRILPALSTTSTFKNKKNELQKEGYDPRAIHDPLYVLDPRLGAYVTLTPALYDELASGHVSF